MKTAPLPPDETERVAALLRYDILDTEFEAAYDELTELASAICGTPISLISLIDPDRQWFKSKVGLEARETSRDLAFCAHAILQEKVFEVEDALEDERFADNPLVVSDPNIRFYAGAPLVTSEGSILGTLCVIDRVPRKLSEEQQRGLQILAKQVMTHLELRLTYRRLQGYAQQMRDSNAAKDKFVYLLAHDLRGPFNWMLGNSQMLAADLDQPGLEECREMAEELGQGCQSTLKLLNHLLDWALSKSGRVEYRPSLVDLDELLAEVFDLLGGLAKSKSIELAREGTSGLKVHADRAMIFSVLQNLLHNAIKFTPPHGQIRVEKTLADSKMLVAVSDTGVGMSDEVLRSVLQLDELLSTEGTEGERGTGIGLQLSQKFVEMHGGTLEVRSQAGVGTTFRFSLPVEASDAPTEQYPQDHPEMVNSLMFS